MFNDSLCHQFTCQELARRFDANETAFLARQLEVVRSRTYEIQYAELLARRFIPIANDIPESAETYVYLAYDTVGAAKIIANGVDDLPRIDVSAAERTGKVRSIGDSYGWDINTMKEAARVGVPLSEMKARAARQAIERGIDEVLSTGTTRVQVGLDWGITGLLNNADVIAQGIINPANDPWSTATASQVLANLNTITNAMVNANSQAFIPDTLLLAPNEFGIIASTPVGVDNQMTILKSFLANNPYIKNIDQWSKLTLAGAGGTTNRGILYKRDPLVLEGVVPLEFEQLPPQARNLEFVVPCHARVGGVKVYQPSAVRYIDFIP